MSALAQHLVHCGYAVSGSDRQVNEQTEKLQKIGVKVHYGHSEQNVKGACLVVRTSAVTPDNCEVAFAQKNNIPVLLREQLLGEIFDAFKQRIAVCGTHGKTTVTAMIHTVLEGCGVPHTAFIGGYVNGENYFNSGNDVIVAEACEYHAAFLNMKPTLCVCLNVRYDHPDCYPSAAHVKRAFSDLFEQSQRVLAPRGLYCRAQPFLKCRKKGNFGVTENGICFPVPPCGGHSLYNAAAALSAAHALNIPLLSAAHALQSFGGVERRWSKVPCCVNAICDYAHHPDEIKSSVSAARKLTDGKLVCLFQPHTYSRTKAFFSQFVTCFDKADEVAYLPVFAAREQPICGATSFRLYVQAKMQGKRAFYLSDFPSAAQWIKARVGANDLLLALGAGDVCKVFSLLPPSAD